MSELRGTGCVSRNLSSVFGALNGAQESHLQVLDFSED